MEIEIFFDKQLSDITFEVDALEEWKDLVDQLGMDKQAALTKGADSPIPYPWMNTCMVNVYSTLCPKKVKFKDYDKTPIPLEVMKQIAFTVKERHFHEIHIWYDDKSPDPVVVGSHGEYYVSESDSSWKCKSNEKGKTIHWDTKEEAKANIDDRFTKVGFSEKGKYLIARWGDVKKDFLTLKNEAIEKFIDTNASKLKSNIAELTQKLETLTENTKLFMEGEMREYDVVNSRF